MPCEFYLLKSPPLSQLLDSCNRFSDPSSLFQQQSFDPQILMRSKGFYYRAKEKKQFSMRWREGFGRTHLCSRAPSTEIAGKLQLSDSFGLK